MASCSPTKRICLKDKEHYTIWILHMRYININKINQNIWSTRESIFSMPFFKFWSLLIVKFLMSKFWSIPLVRPTDSFDCKLKLFTSPLANSQWESRIWVIIKRRVFDFFYIYKGFLHIVLFSNYGLGIARLRINNTCLTKKQGRNAHFELFCQLHNHMTWCYVCNIYKNV